MWKSALALLAAAALQGCQKPPSESAAPSTGGPLQKVTFAYTLQPQSTLIHVAMAKGFFANEGLDVQPLVYTYGKAALQSLLDYKADFATVAETPFMFNVLNGEKISIIANIEASSQNNAVVARRDAGIASGGDLIKKRIGFTPGTTSDFFLDSLLTANGLERRDIQAVPLLPEDMAAAVTARTVDAVSTWNYPLRTISQALGANGIILFDRDIYTETFNVAVQQDFAKAHPETIQRLIRALVKAEEFVAGNKDEVQSIMSSATGTDINLVRDVWEVFHYRVDLDQRLIIALEDETRWAMKRQLVEQAVMPDYRKFISFDGLKAVKPEAIKIK